MRIQPRFIQGWQEESHASATVPLGKRVVRYLNPPAGRWRFHCMVIAAHRGDGITTASRQAEQSAHRLVGERAVARLTGEDLPRLAITELLTAATVVRAAVRAGVDPGQPVRRRSGFALLGAVIVFVLTAGLSLLVSATASGAPTADETLRALTNPWYLLVAVLGGAVVIVTEPLLHLRSSVTGERLERITAATATMQAPQAARDRFIALLAAALLDDRNRRCLIVDDFARLDAVSQAVIRQALETIAADRSELWIVFESADLSVDPGSPSATLVGELGRHVLARRQPSPAAAPTAPALRSNATLLFELTHLSADQRGQLVEDCVREGRTANPGYVIVKDILGGDASAPEREAFKRSWPPESVRADAALREALTLLYLLSISAPPGYAVTFPLDKLPAELSVIAPHREVLELLLGTRPTLDTVSRRLERTREVFARFVEQDRSESPIVLRLSAAIQDVLTSQQADYRLPGVELVHLFWALYRFDRGSPDRTTWLQPQTRHLRQAADPSAVGSPDVAATFGAALLAVIDACLDFGRLTDAATLLVRAFNLGAEPGFPLDPVALRRRSRGLYAVGANAALLTRAAQSAPADATPGESTDEPAADLLIELFEQATPGVVDMVRLCRVDEALGTDLRLRAVWLALSLQPVAGSALPRDLPLSRTVVDAHLALPLLTQKILDHADTHVTAASADEWPPAALASVTTALWCLALADETLTGPILSRIDTGSVSVPRDPAAALSSDEWSEWMSTVDVYLVEGLEHGLFLARRTPTPVPGYANAGARSELLVVTVAAAIRIRLTWTSLQRTNERRLDAVILEGCGELGIQVPQDAVGRLTPAALLSLAERVAKRMSSIEVTWTALGYPRAAAALNTRRVQFLAGLPGGRSPDVAAALGDRGSNDLFGIIANLAAAGDAAAHPSVRAEIVAAAVGRLLVGGRLGEALAAQLCLLTVKLGSAFSSVDIRRQLRYLAAPPDDGSRATRLDVLLALVAEDALDSLYIALVNITDSSDQVDDVIGALRRRSADVADPMVARALRTRLDTYELIVAVSRGRHPDVDATLDSWRNRRGLPVYAFVLYLLAASQNAEIPERLRQEADAVLHDPAVYFSETGIQLLANHIARTTQARDQAKTADLVHVLRAGAHRVGQPSLLPLSEAIDALRHLFRLDPGNASRYRAPLLDLQRNELRLFSEQRLAALLAERQYAALLRTYWEMFHEFLPVAEDPDSGRVTAFVGVGRDRLNAKFLRDLFDPDERVRARVDTLTRSALIRVLDLLAEVPEMPADMAGLLRQHRVLVQRAGGSDVSL